MAPSYNADVLTTLIRSEVESRGRGAKARLAEATGVTPQTISKWVSGEVRPEPERWAAIESHFGWEDGEIRRQVMPLSGPDTTVELVRKLQVTIEDLARRVAVLEGQSRGDRSGSPR